MAPGCADFGSALEPLASSGTNTRGTSGQGITGTAQEYGQYAAQRIADTARGAADAASQYTGYVPHILHVAYGICSCLASIPAHHAGADQA